MSKICHWIKEEKKELEDKLKECKEKCNDNLVITDDKEVVKFIMEVLDKAIPQFS
ncbi:hypothetical protein [Spiroplasma endosymbiont of Polydrusus pterygomalis]|uniref:hypothetical protein n=1 Tax=Spiroplasma endosymbiont of Polydrusus pterygomalis TaxID=3139327 RepID=UPI003CCB2D8D